MTERTLTPPEGWLGALAQHRPRVLDVAALGRLLVLAAHPDDETLAVGGLMRAAHRAGQHVELVVATDGDAAFPDLDRPRRAALGRARRRELHTALHAQGLDGVLVHWLGLPDSGLDVEAAAAALAPLLAGMDSYLAPWVHDPHPDHAAAGHAAAMAAPITMHGWSYPIWMWAWQQPNDPGIPWSLAFAHRLDPSARRAKRDAIDCFTSQLQPGPHGQPPILSEAVLGYFDTDVEVLFRVPPRIGAPARRFTELYRGGDGDPWQTKTSWYEQRKRAVLVACLPRSRYHHAAEPGCGTGELTRELAARCERVDASDFTDDAVRLTAASVRDLPGVSVRPATLPDGLPPGIDLAVLSEVLYYLGPEQLGSTVARLAEVLVPGGDLVMVHWRGWPAEAPQDAQAVHRRLLDDGRFEPLVDHRDSEFVLHVLRRR